MYNIILACLPRDHSCTLRNAVFHLLPATPGGCAAQQWEIIPFLLEY